jgi:hypothetical protein
MKAAHQQEETLAFWTGVEDWLREKVSNGRDNHCSKILFVFVLPGNKNSALFTFPSHKIIMLSIWALL